MGTRSTTTIKDEAGRTLVTLYRQYDGYPTGHGQQLADFLAARTVINGFGNQTAETHANGMGCLAAQLISYFKGDQIGNIYVTCKGDSQEYNYTVYLNEDGELAMKCESEYYGMIYIGLASEFNGSVVEKNSVMRGV